MADRLPDPNLAWPIPLAAVGLIADAEGCKLKAYRCPAGIPTIGWGHTHKVTMGDVCTQQQADQWLLTDISESAAEVRAACTVEPGDNELGALTSFAFNCRGWRSSSVLKAHNRGDHIAASRAFGLWNKATVNGVLTELQGLTARRAAEQALYLKPENAEASLAMPQAVQAEEPLRQSTTIKSGTVIGGAGVVAGLGQVVGSVQGLGDPLKATKTVLTETLGIPASWLLPMVCLVVAYILLRDRIQRRLDGWV